MPQNPVPYRSHPYGMKIEVKDLTFRCKSDSAPVLKNMNFTIEPCQIVSIFGYNGSGSNPAIHARLTVGKTTLIPFSNATLVEIKIHLSIFFCEMHFTCFR